MSPRELTILGTASQVPTRTRAHNGYVLRFDAETILFDPGEGTQRQMLFARVPAGDVTRIAITHLHGDHVLGLAGVVQGLSLNDVPQTVPISYPASGRRYVDHLLDASVYAHRQHVAHQPVDGSGPLERVAGEITSGAQLSAVRLDHPVDAYGYRLVEPDGRTMDPDRLTAAGITGPAVGRLIREGHLDVGGRDVTVEQMSRPRPGQKFGFCMDTRLCDGAYQIADGADLLVVEATFLDRDGALAREAGHLTARQAATLATECGVRTLVLTHFSGRYLDPGEFADEARERFDGDLHIAADLDRVPLPARLDARER